MSELISPCYLGDGVYASFDGHHLWLETHEGMKIALEPAVFFNLVKFHDDLPALLKERTEK